MARWIWTAPLAMSAFVAAIVAPTLTRKATVEVPTGQHMVVTLDEPTMPFGEVSRRVVEVELDGPAPDEAVLDIHVPSDVQIIGVVGEGSNQIAASQDSVVVLDPVFPSTVRVHVKLGKSWPNNARQVATVQLDATTAGMPTTETMVVHGVVALE